LSPTPRAIPGTTPFDGTMARKGYALNKMCFSFNDKANRDAFLADTEGYMRQYALTPEQADAVRSGQVLQMLAAGGNATTWPSSRASSGWTCRTSARSRPV